MAIRRLLMGALSAIVFMAFAAADGASAATKRGTIATDGSKAERCVSARRPRCSLTRDLVCRNRMACGACRLWICQRRELAR